MRPELARTVWHVLEPLNAVTYFSPECRDAPAKLGLTGFWMGYFACRAAPMGPVGPGLVEALFFNFHPDRVCRALPAAWGHASPDAVIEARSAAAAAALRRLVPGGGADELAASVLPTLTEVIDSAGLAGRPLFAANRDLAPPADPVAALWQATTTLREHRGDGHVALLTGAGLDGCEALVLFAATENLPDELFQASRGWSVEEWASASDRLRSRGLLTAEGSPTDAGRRLRDEIERRTDALAAGAYVCLGDSVGDLVAHLEGPARTIAAAGEITFPNPMGLPAPSAAQA